MCIRSLSLRSLFFTVQGLLIACVIQAQSLAPIKHAADSLGFMIQVGDTAPDFELVLDSGKRFKLSEHKGEVILLQFTASWCSVCRQEMPFLEADIWQKHKDAGLLFIGVDRDEPLAKLEELRNSTKITYPLGLDPGAAVFGLFADKKSGVTRNVLIGRSGKVLFLTRLYKPEEFDHLKEQVQLALDQSK